jgi:DNA topoisomerase-1
MAAKEQETTTVDLAADGYELRATATRTTFDGFSRVYIEGQDDSDEEAECRLPALARGDATAVESVQPLQHFTEPPPRYTEATLIKALEEHGIGRPSTYAATISTILDRGYVKVQEKRLYPEPIGETVTDLLVCHFGEFVDLEFTARMEDDLDDVASGKRPWVPVVREFYTPFRTRVDEKTKELRRADFTTRPSEQVCSLGHPMVVRLGRYGEFLACAMYPEHKETRELPGPGSGKGESGNAGQSVGPGEPPVVEECPRCGATDGGVLVARRGRFGRFTGCSRYPDCEYIKKDGPPPPAPLAFDVACPSCREGRLVTRRARRTGSLFWGCSRYPKCRYTTSHEPVGAVHDTDGGPVGRAGEAGLCLVCGAPVELAAGDVVGKMLPGGEPNPAALTRPATARPRRRTGRARSGAGARTPGGRKTAGAKAAGARRGG